MMQGNGREEEGNWRVPPYGDDPKGSILDKAWYRFCKKNGFLRNAMFWFLRFL